LKQAEVGIPVPEVIRKAGIEMLRIALIDVSMRGKKQRTKIRKIAAMSPTPDQRMAIQQTPVSQTLEQQPPCAGNRRGIRKGNVTQDPG
jgi:hypothetical protein